MSVFLIADVGSGSPSLQLRRNEPHVPYSDVGSKILAALGFYKSLRGLVVCISHSRKKCRLQLFRIQLAQQPHHQLSLLIVGLMLQKLDRESP